MSPNTDRRRRLCLIGLGLLIVGVLIAAGDVISAWKWYRLVRLRDEGAKATATITKNDIDTSRRHSADVIYYEFQPEGSARKRTDVIKLYYDYGQRDRLTTIKLNMQSCAGTLIVRYLADDPDFFCLEWFLAEKISDARLEVLGFAGLAGLLGLAGLGLALWGLPAWRSRRRECRPATPT